MKDFSKCDKIHRKLQIWTHLLKQSLMENFSFCAAYVPAVLSMSRTSFERLMYVKFTSCVYENFFLLDFAREPLFPLAFQLQT